jgi:hypothetical protein
MLKAVSVAFATVLAAAPASAFVIDFETYPGVLRPDRTYRVENLLLFHEIPGQGSLPFEIRDGAVVIAPGASLFFIMDYNGGVPNPSVRSVFRLDIDSTTDILFGDNADFDLFSPDQASGLQTVNFKPVHEIGDDTGAFVIRSTGAEITVDNIHVSLVGVPEPATWAMMIAGFGAVGGFARRSAARKAQATA